MSQAILFDIERNSYVDGPGIRTTVFFKGCNLKCAWCHNPESQSFHPQMMFYADKCIGCGKCRQVCPHACSSCSLCGKCALYCPKDARKVCGREYTLEKVLSEIRKDIPFYETSGGGVTFSGGECMLQIDFLEDILKECKQHNIHTAVDTAGYVPYERFERILPYTDLFLYDVKLFDSQKHKQFTGVDNELILENLQRLLSSGAKLWIRIPVIANVNDDPDEMQRIKAFLERCGKPEKVELLPYHAMGENKYHALGQEPQLFSKPTDEKLKQLKEIFA